MNNHEDHEAHEGHEDHEGLIKRDERKIEHPMPSPWHRMRLPSPLPAETESVMTETIGCAIAVHRALGPGFLERIYRRGMYIELEAHRLAYEAEHPVKVVYRDCAQVISYMKTAGLRAGLLINFRAPTLRQGLRRFVL